jgi:four helix bundle protein
MGFRTLGEVRAYQAAREFKREVYRLLASSARAQNDFDFRTQLRRAARSCVINIAEGFGRHLAGEFIYFLRISRGSLHEALDWIDDGVDSGYFDATSCTRARELGDKTGRLTTSLINSLKPFVRSSRPPARAKKAAPAKPPQGPPPAGTEDS